MNYRPDYSFDYPDNRLDYKRGYSLDYKPEDRNYIHGGNDIFGNNY